jgi:hypothetical protein
MSEDKSLFYEAGNDVRSLVNIYVDKLGKITTADGEDLYFFKFILSALPLSLFVNLYGCFPDKIKGRAMSAQFFEGFEELIIDEKANDLLMEMMGEIAYRIPNEGKETLVNYYRENLERTVEQNEITLLQEFTMAVFEFYKQHSKIVDSR